MQAGSPIKYQKSEKYRSTDIPFPLYTTEDWNERIKRKTEKMMLTFKSGVWIPRVLSYLRVRLCTKGLP